ncbi:MAG: hypothetical protein RIB57_12410 [Pelagibacterium sp.]|uniref:hypothetical protein n=1 Tax=Pelagibacterium sp. TaxID=1967288 RepID=UPI0032EE49D0
MPIPEPTDRLEQSRKVLTAWETMGLPSGIEGHLQVITDEVLALDALAHHHPEHLPEVAHLVERYVAMADRFKVRAH